MFRAALASLLTLAACARSSSVPDTRSDDADTGTDTGTDADTDTDTIEAPPDPSSCAPATPADIRDREGDYYRCLDSTLVGGDGCGTAGYPLGFGAKYADRSFQETWYELTSAGQDFFLAVSPCLQERLAAQVTAASTCDHVWDDGFATHADCYVDSGFCDLPAEDLYVIGTMFDADVYAMDEFTQQLTDVARGCAGI